MPFTSPIAHGQFAIADMQCFHPADIRLPLYRRIVDAVLLGRANVMAMGKPNAPLVDRRINSDRF